MFTPGVWYSKRRQFILLQGFLQLRYKQEFKCCTVICKISDFNSWLSEKNRLLVSIFSFSRWHWFSLCTRELLKKNPATSILLSIPWPYEYFLDHFLGFFHIKDRRLKKKSVYWPFQSKGKNKIKASSLCNVWDELWELVSSGYRL